MMFIHSFFLAGRAGWSGKSLLNIRKLKCAKFNGWAQASVPLPLPPSPKYRGGVFFYLRCITKSPVKHRWAQRPNLFLSECFKRDFPGRMVFYPLLFEIIYHFRGAGPSTSFVISTKERSYTPYRRTVQVAWLGVNVLLFAWLEKAVTFRK